MIPVWQSQNREFPERIEVVRLEVRLAFGWRAEHRAVNFVIASLRCQEFSVSVLVNICQSKLLFQTRRVERCPWISASIWLDLPLTTGSKETLENAETAAKEFRHQAVVGAHVLLALLKQEGGIAHEVLTSHRLLVMEVSERLVHLPKQVTSADRSKVDYPALAMRYAEGFFET